MGGITDEWLFYGGMFLAAGSLIALILYLCVSKLRFARLRAQLEEEYGKRER